jgi:hypothetical protein
MQWFFTFWRSLDGLTLEHQSSPLAEGGKSGVNEPIFTVGQWHRRHFTASLCALVFVLALNYEPRLRPFPLVHLFEIGLIWYLPIFSRFWELTFLSLEIKSKVAQYQNVDSGSV